MHEIQQNSFKKFSPQEWFPSPFDVWPSENKKKSFSPIWWWKGIRCHGMPRGAFSCFLVFQYGSLFWRGSDFIGQCHPVVPEELSVEWSSPGPGFVFTHIKMWVGCVKLFFLEPEPVFSVLNTDGISRMRFPTETGNGSSETVIRPRTGSVFAGTDLSLLSSQLCTYISAWTLSCITAWTYSHSNTRK